MYVDISAHWDFFSLGCRLRLLYQAQDLIKISEPMTSDSTLFFFFLTLQSLFGAKWNISFLQVILLYTDIHIKWGICTILWSLLNNYFKSCKQVNCKQTNCTESIQHDTPKAHSWYLDNNCIVSLFFAERLGHYLNIVTNKKG